MRFDARLYLDRPGSPGLPVSLELEDHHLRVHGSDGPLGSWPLREVGLRPLGDGRFELSVADDRVLLVPHDPLLLEDRVLPLLQETPRGTGVLHRLRSWVSEAPEHPRPASPERSPSTPDPVPEPPSPTDRCRGRRRDGADCRSPVIGPSGYCFAHDPDRAEERRRVRLRASRVSGPLRRRLAETLEELARGRLDPLTALATAELIRTMWLVTETPESTASRAPSLGIVGIEVSR